MATAKGLVYGGARRVRSLSSRAASAVGRPSPARWSNRTQAQGESKLSVRRLIRRDPAKGRSLPLADRITDTKMASNRPPSAGISSRDRTAPPGTNKSLIRNRGINRRIRKR